MEPDLSNKTPLHLAQEIVALTLWPSEGRNSLLGAPATSEAAAALRSGFSVRVMLDDPKLDRMAAVVVRRAAGMR